MPERVYAISRESLHQCHSAPHIPEALLLARSHIPSHPKALCGSSSFSSLPQPPHPFFSSLTFSSSMSPGTNRAKPG